MGHNINRYTVTLIIFTCLDRRFNFRPFGRLSNSKMIDVQLDRKPPISPENFFTSAINSNAALHTFQNIEFITKLIVCIVFLYSIKSVEE